MIFCENNFIKQFEIKLNCLISFSVKVITVSILYNAKYLKPNMDYITWE